MKPTMPITQQLARPAIPSIVSAIIIDGENRPRHKTIASRPAWEATDY
jgi:hypothetical protein